MNIINNIFSRNKIIYTASFGDYDDERFSADKIFNETNNIYDGCSEHLSPRLMAKLYKVLNPFSYDIWIDSSIDLLDRKGFENLFDGDFCVLKHSFHKTVKDELDLCKKLGYINDKQEKIL